MEASIKVPLLEFQASILFVYSLFYFAHFLHLSFYCMIFIPFNVGCYTGFQQKTSLFRTDLLKSDIFPVVMLSALACKQCQVERR